MRVLCVFFGFCVRVFGFSIFSLLFFFLFFFFLYFFSPFLFMCVSTFLFFPFHSLWSLSLVGGPVLFHYFLVESDPTQG